MLVERCLIILAVAAAAPPRRTSRSILSCGESLEVLGVSSSELSEEEMDSKIKMQYRQAMDNYRMSNYDSLYERVRIGVHDHQYIPNWLPGQKDVNLVQKLANATFQTVSALTRLIDAFVTSTRCVREASSLPLLSVPANESALNTNTRHKLRVFVDAAILEIPLESRWRARHFLNRIS